jgi:dihydroorotase
MLLLNANIVNEGTITQADVLIKNSRIERIGNLSYLSDSETIDLKGAYLLPGLIDDQVHFREPGLTQKGTIGSESKAAIAGGTTTFMEMPNTVPNALTLELLQDKYNIASQSSWANYSFYMGCANHNAEEALRTDPKTVCGMKIFMGSSTGNMLVDHPQVLENYFRNAPTLIATHCEDETTVRRNMELYKERFGTNAHPRVHPEIRNVEACTLSSSLAIDLAKKFNTKLHILHISTGEETDFFEVALAGKPKNITAEACVHHLWFTADQYETLGNQIKCNPAIKADGHRQKILQAVLDDRIDVIATDHAPHLWNEKQNEYFSAPSGLPLVQHSLLMLMDFVNEGKMPITRVVDKTSHAVADLFQIIDRGYIREGYFADLVVVQPTPSDVVSKSKIHYHCGWSPLEGHTFSHTVSHTIVNGNLMYANGAFANFTAGQRILFNR